jgi:hypothetical protein
MLRTMGAKRTGGRRVAARRRRRLHAEPTEPGEHGSEPIEVDEDGVGLRLADECECDGRLDGGRRFVALGTRATKALAPIVAVAGGGFGEVEIRAEQSAPHLVAERAVAARELADECVSRDERAPGDVKCLESVMSETSGVHGEASLPGAPGLDPPSAGAVTTPNAPYTRHVAEASARHVRVRSGPGAQGKEAERATGLADASAIANRGLGLRGLPAT